MAELERELIVLGSYIDLPGESDLWPGIAARLERRPTSRRLRLAVVVVAAVATAIGVAFAVPPARSAILRFLGLESVAIIRVDRLPPAASGPGAVGARVSLAEAKRLLPFRLLLPDTGTPDGIYVDADQGLLTVVYGRGTVHLRFTELIGTDSPVFTKIVYSEQHVERLRVNGGPGLWIQGQHVISTLFGEPRLSGSALIWEQESLTLRLEGRLTKTQALRIARSVRAG